MYRKMTVCGIAFAFIMSLGLLSGCESKADGFGPNIGGIQLGMAKKEIEEKAKIKFDNMRRDLGNTRYFIGDDKRKAPVTIEILDNNSYFPKSADKTRIRWFRVSQDFLRQHTQYPTRMNSMVSVKEAFNNGIFGNIDMSDAIYSETDRRIDIENVKGNWRCMFFKDGGVNVIMIRPEE